MTLPTPAQGAPYAWVVVMDNNGNYVTSIPVTEANSTAILAKLNAGLTVTIANTDTLGQQLMAASHPVVLASDEVVPVQFGGTAQYAVGPGLTPANLLAIMQYLTTSGGPVDSSGKPQMMGADQWKTLQGSGVAGSTANITATVAGDTNLVFGSAPKTLYPGAKVQLAVGTNAVTEGVVVSETFTPSSSATTIPLQNPVVNANLTTAKWDIFTAIGPNGSTIQPSNIGVVALAVQDGGGGTGNICIASSAGADAQSTSKYLEAAGGAFNGSNIDRVRNNTEATLLASAARTGTTSSTDQVNYNAKGVLVTVDVTALTATGTLTPEIDYKDSVSGKYISLLTASAAIVTTGTYVYLVYPGTTLTVTNTGVTQSSDMVLPRTWKTTITHGNAVSITYSVGVSYIV